MKKSKYNHFFDINNKKLAFNGISCALAEIDENFEQIYNRLEDIDYEQLSAKEKELADNMLAGFYIIPDCTDELALLKFRNYRGKYSSDYLSLVIAPTMACNFACPYCFENPKPGVMRQEVQDKLVEIVRVNAERKKPIHITWYGGEPLLAKNVVFSLSEKFIKICEENNVEYSSQVITNGYLLSTNDIPLFKKFKIKEIQITIDGPRDIHNQRRFLKAKPQEGSFDVIIDNVRMMKANEFIISLRVNIDKENIESTKELILYLKEVGLSGLFINFGHVAPYTDVNQNIKGSCLSMGEYSKESLQLQEFLFENGFDASRFPYYPGIKANYCGADSISAFVIDNEGYKYKCWNEVGDISMSVGNILWDIEMYTDEMLAREVSYMTWTPFDHEECRDCFTLPICMGGCPYSGKRLNAVYCEKWKFGLLDVLVKTYEQKSKDQIAECCKEEPMTV